MKTISFDELIQVVSKAYDCDGVIARLHEEQDEVGDVLAEFIYREIGDVVDIDKPLNESDIEVVTKALRKGVVQLDYVVDAVNDLASRMRITEKGNVTKVWQCRKCGRVKMRAAHIPDRIAISLNCDCEEPRINTMVEMVMP